MGFMREFFPCLALCLGLLFGLTAQGLGETPSFERLPRWRGFNLLEKFSKDWSNKPYLESDFRQIAALGFNFVRLPMNYRVWIEDGDWTRFNENTLKELDQAVAWGRKHGVHVCLNFHRAPGYCVNPPNEPRDL